MKCKPEKDSEEFCPAREGDVHCNCWYDGKPCCGCGDDKQERDLIQEARASLLRELAEALANPNLASDEIIPGVNRCLYDLVASCTDADVWEAALRSLLGEGEPT